jgi:translation initiation factor IF-3
LKVNREIKAPQLRVIDEKGEQVGLLDRDDALRLAQQANLDLVEVAPLAKPPVCKIIDYGKFRYTQTKKERGGKKGTSQGKLKEVKLKPNIDDHDFDFKLKRARSFIEKGSKVKITCMFRGREMAHKEIGVAVVRRMIDRMEDIATPEAPLKLLGRNLITVVAPGVKKKKEDKPVKKETPEKSSIDS